MGLKRSLTLFGATTLVVGNVVGAGIFTTSGTLAGEIGNPHAFLLVWVAGGFFTIAGALTYAELGAMFPRAGGDYQFLKEAYGPLAGFLIGWLNFWIISPGSIAALSIAFVSYLPGLSFDHNDFSGGLVAALVILVLSGISYRSTRLASSTQSIVTVGTMTLLISFVTAGALFGNGDPAHFVRAETDALRPSIFFGPAMIAVLFTYSGWFAAAYVGSEIKNPGRNVPLALIIGTLIVTLLYTGANAVYLYAMPLEEMRGATNVAHLAAGRLFGPTVAAGVGAAILLGIGSCTNGAIITGSRVCFAMAEDQLLPSALGRVHPTYGTPFVAISVQAALGVCMVLIGTFDRLLGYVVFAMLLACMATGMAHVVLRFRRPEAPRPYRTIGYPVVPLLFVGTYAWIALSIARHSPATSLLGIGFALTGVPFYFWKRPQK